MQVLQRPCYIHKGRWKNQAYKRHRIKGVEKSLKATETLQMEAEAEIETEKEQTIKEVFKDLLLDIQKAGNEFGEAKQRHEDAVRKYADARTDHNFLMKLCLQKVTTHPIKTKD
jgi:hypothetical protein